VTGSALVLTATAASAIRAHARLAYPEECCGALIADATGEIVVALALDNTAADGRRRFLISPSEYLRSEREADRLDGHLAGFYHSHPDHPAMPSATDLLQAWPNVSYVIVAVDHGTPRQAHSWRLTASRDGFHEETLIEREPPGGAMPVPVHIPTPLRSFTGDRAVVEVAGQTIAEVLSALVAAYPGLRPHLFGDDGQVRSFVNVYLDDTDVRYLEKGATPVAAGRTVSIVPSVAGGSGTGAVDDLPTLDPQDYLRYGRHLIMPEVGVTGQRRLKAAKVLCVGAGGLGSPAATYLAAAGIGTLGLVDFDVVDASNLQRQILYSTADVGRPKLAAAEDRLRAINPSVRIVRHDTALTSANALDILSAYDVVVDGADNFPTRYLVNDACVLLGKPNAYGSIFRFDGQISVFAATGGPCYRCLYPEPPPPGLVPSCAEGGVLGVLPGIVGTIQAAEAIKLITGAGTPLVGRLMLFDALAMQVRTLALRRDRRCPVCGDEPEITRLIDYQQFCGIVPAAPPPATLPDEWQISVEALKAKRDRGEPVWVLDVREPHEFEICRIEGATLIPLGQLDDRLAEVPRGVDAPPVVVHCKGGVRSAKAVRRLREAGFTQVRNLTGGIIEWINRIDPSQARY
jgi:molybdopterin/thiamine biosynthesis adenylyltransferase/rhodanese-related sulfurtransferase/proteasome lid subunit RPN8/RPN11/molybdopterin converting factor small subunit